MNILISDNSSDIRMIIKYYLLSFKHTVELAVDGDDAWKKIKAKDYQVVISDWKMPKINRLELCKKIRKYNFNNYIYFILLTGASGKNNTLDSIKAGVDDFVSKVVELNELEIRFRSATRILQLETSLESKNKALKKVKQQIESDLKQARETQLGLLPAFLNTNMIKTAWFYKPAVFVGGDTFNYF